MADDDLFGLSLRDYLAGPWWIERMIEDRRAGANGNFTGEGRFEAVGAAALHYREQGMLRLNGADLPASQAYHWVFDAKGAAVTFTDGRPFHRVAHEGGAATALHDCPPDTYRVVYRFETADRWRQRWIVTGPRKDHTLESHYTRLHPPGDPVHPAPE